MIGTCSVSLNVQFGSSGFIFQRELKYGLTQKLQAGHDYLALHSRRVGASNVICIGGFLIILSHLPLPTTTVVTFKKWMLACGQKTVQPKMAAGWKGAGWNCSPLAFAPLAGLAPKEVLLKGKADACSSSWLSLLWAVILL